MADAQARGWGDPWASTYRSDNIVSVRVPSSRGDVYLPVHRRVAPLFVAFITEARRRGYDIGRVADDWGYARRCQRGTGPGTSRPCVTSNHAWGLAVDLNATANPMGSPLRTDIPPWMVDLAADYGLAWGGTWKTPDPMHFEFTGTPGEADALIAKLAKRTWKWSGYVPAPRDFTSACRDPATGGWWRQTAEGGIEGLDGAWAHGSYKDHPELHNVPRLFVALIPSEDGGYRQIAHTGESYAWAPGS